MDRRDIEDLFAPVGRFEVRRMFGGFGVFDEGLMVALVAQGVVYLKVDAESAPTFEEAGLEPFTYTAKGHTKALSYRRLPEAAFDDTDVLAEWCGLARSAARRAALSKPAARRASKRKRLPKEP